MGVSAQFIQIVLAVGLIVLITAAPILAWPRTRKYTPWVLLSYTVFLAIHWQFVIGEEVTYHDTAWNLESWSIIIQQWIDSGHELGWNPYWGAGQPFSLYNNILSTIPSVAFAYLFNALGWHFEPTVFFNLIWLFGFLNICTGSLMLFSILFAETWVILIGFFSMLFGGLFFADLGQGVGVYTLSFLPYLLFSLIYFYRNGDVRALVFFLFALGMSLNYYLPTYTLVTILVFIIGVLARRACRTQILSKIKTLPSHPGWLALGVLVFTILIAPLFMNYLEMKDYVSPTRGFTKAGEYSELGHQASTFTPISRYEFLINFRKWDLLNVNHGTFYIGALPTLGFVLALVFRTHIFLTIPALISAILGMEHVFGISIWEWLRSYVPLFKMTRHGFPFARIATLLILAASLGGIWALTHKKYSLKWKYLAIAIAFLAVHKLSWGGLSPFQRVNVLLATGVLVFLAKYSNSNGKTLVSYLLLILLTLHGLELISFSINRDVPRRDDVDFTEYTFPRNYKLNEITYPDHWVTLPYRGVPVPFYFRPMFNKRIVWGQKVPNSLFMLQSDFARFLLNQRLISQVVPEDPELRKVSGKLFYLIPHYMDVSPDQTSIEALQWILNANRPKLALKDSSYKEPSVGNVLDRDPRTYWQSVPREQNRPLWISFSIQNGFRPDILELQISPVLKGRNAKGELWSSDDNEHWNFVQMLDGKNAMINKPSNTLKFYLKNPLRQKFFKLVFFNDSFFPLADVALNCSHVDCFESPLDFKLKLNSFYGLHAVNFLPSGSPDKIVLNVFANQDSWLLRMENFHKGWKVFLDGKEEEIHRVFPNFQMVFVPAGQHTLEFRFHSIYHTLVVLHIVTGVLGGAFLLWWLSGIQIRMRNPFPVPGWGGVR